MGIIFTNHAISRLYNRNIDQYDAWYTLKYPHGTTDGSTPGSVKFWRNYGDQTIEVVAKKNEHKEWVVLSAWARQYGNGRRIFPKKDSLWLRLLKFFWRNLVRLIRRLLWPKKVTQKT
jgi:hypothetical protein